MNVVNVLKAANVIDVIRVFIAMNSVNEKDEIHANDVIHEIDGNNMMDDIQHHAGVKRLV